MLIFSKSFSVPFVLFPNIYWTRNSIENPVTSSTSHLSRTPNLALFPPITVKHFEEPLLYLNIEPANLGQAWLEWMNSSNDCWYVSIFFEFLRFNCSKKIAIRLIWIKQFSILGQPIELKKIKSEVTQFFLILVWKYSHAALHHVIYMCCQLCT